jgi:hypothetical protein
MTLEDVKVWVIVRGIGHVVMSRNDSSILGTITACGMGGNMHAFTYVKPKRICKKCRDELPHVYKVGRIAL